MHLGYVFLCSYNISFTSTACRYVDCTHTFFDSFLKFYGTRCVCVTRLTIDSLAFVLRVLLLQQTPVWPSRNRSADREREIYIEQAAKHTAFPPAYANEHSVQAARASELRGIMNALV